jgi:inner membrane protein
MFGFMLLGLIVPSLFSLIDKEIGARRHGPKGRVAATVALLAVVLMWGLRDYEHRRAVSALAARTYQDAEPLRVSAYPALANPFQWYGVVETRNFFVLTPVNSLGPEVDPEDHLSIRYKPEETPITLAAKKSYLGRVYLDWAQYPITETETLPSPQGEYIVTFQDLRFVQLPSPLGKPGQTRRALSAGVQLDKNLHVIGDIYGSGENQKAYPEPD